MNFTTFFFDLDDTLYPPSSGLWNQIGGRITRYMTERMGLEPRGVTALREKYFREYGTTLRGLQANHAVNTEEYLAYVHDVPLEEFLRPDPVLRSVLSALGGRKFIFTNADANHANRVLGAIGLQGLFEGIIDVHTLTPFCKPMKEAFDLALRAAGDPQPSRCVLLDDQARITRAARAAGLYAVLVGRAQAGEDADAALTRLTELGQLLKGES